MCFDKTIILKYYFNKRKFFSLFIKIQKNAFRKIRKIVFNRIRKIVFNNIVQNFLCLIKIVQKNCFVNKVVPKINF